MVANFCFSCNIWGFRIFCLTPKQNIPESVEAVSTSKSTRSVYFTKKKRETWTKNNLISFYFFAGLAGLGLVITSQVGTYERGLSEFCAHNFMSNEALCEMGWPSTEVRETSDIVYICVGSAEVCMAIVGIVSAHYVLKRAVIILAFGFLLLLVTQVSVAGYDMAVNSYASFNFDDNPFVSNKDLVQIDKFLTEKFYQAMTNKEVYLQWTTLQRAGCCCGVAGYHDWLDHDHEVPAVCHCIKLNDEWYCNPYKYDYFGCNNPIHYNGTMITKKGCLQYYTFHYGQYRGLILETTCLIIIGLSALMLPAIIAPLVAVCCRNCCFHSPDSSSLDMPIVHSDDNEHDDGDVPLLDDQDEGTRTE